MIKLKDKFTGSMLYYQVFTQVLEIKNQLIMNKFHHSILNEGIIATQVYNEIERITRNIVLDSVHDQIKNELTEDE